MILVLAGTVEGRRTAKLLHDRGFPVVATVTTDYGRSLLILNGLKDVVKKKLTARELEELIVREKVQVVVDATHPYAVQISSYAINVSDKLGIPYIRLERKKSFLPDLPTINYADSLEDAVDMALARGKRIFCSMGSKYLADVMEKARKKGARVIARVLPLPEVITKCLELGLKPDDIVAMQGPFTRELNRELYKYYDISVMLTKESGEEGGLVQKVAAALELGIPCVIWKRPVMEYPLVVNSPEDVLAFVESINKGRFMK